MITGALLLATGLFFLAVAFFTPSPEAWPAGVALALLGLFICSDALLRRRPSPIGQIAVRWLRAGLFAFVFACLMNWWLQPEPADWRFEFGRFFVFGVLVWLLIDGMRTWLLVSAISRSELALFPRFIAQAEDAGWPNQPRYLALRETLRKNGWRLTTALRSEESEDMGGLHLHAFLSADRQVSLQLYFILLPTGGITWAGLLESWTPDNQRLVTDNFFLPCAGFYPENWHVKRSVWTRSFASLEKLHRRRMKKFGASGWIDLHGCSALDIEAQQRAVEQVNLKMGFLTDPAQREENGSLTSAGRYALWKEVLLLNYFGIARGC